LDLKLNPILAEGAIHILALASIVGLITLNLSSCSFDESIGDPLLHVLKHNKTMRSVNLSINRLGEDVGLKVIEAMQHNKMIRTLDIRNTDITLPTKSSIDALVLENRKKNNTIYQ
jgi:hypothetical protein